MMKKSTNLLTIPAAAFLLACGGSPVSDPMPEPVPAPAPATPQSQETPAASPDATAEPKLSDERAMELARAYAELLQAGDFEGIWEHLSPAGREELGSLDQFRSEGARIMDSLGTEAAVVREGVQAARAGMRANKMYLRVSYYSGAGESPVRLIIGLMNDGSIAGLQIRPMQ